MKRLIVCAIMLSTALVSCKKDRTCSCKVTMKGTSTTSGKASIELFPGFSTPLADTSFTQQVYDIQTVDKKMEKVSKRTAKNNCVSYTEPYYETIPTSVPASSFNLSVVVISKGEKTYDCELK